MKHYQEQHRLEQQKRREMQLRQRKRDVEAEERMRRYPDVPVIGDDDDDDDEDEDQGKELRKDEPLTGHSNNGLYEGMPYISQPLPDPEGEFDLASTWGGGGGGGGGRGGRRGGEGGPENTNSELAGWNSNWNYLVEDPELYWGMGVTYDRGE